MARPYELIVFDWDGTLMDSAALIVDSMQAACRDLGLAEPSDEAARQVIGLGLHDALARAIPSADPSEYVRIADRYRHHFLTRHEDLRLFAGAYELLEALHERKLFLAVATGKSRKGLERSLDLSGLGRFFHRTRCADESFSKPHPAMLHEIMDELCMTPEQTLMVGDTTHDLLMAANAGVDAVAVSFGAHPREVLLQEKHVACFERFAQLSDWLLARL